MNSANKTTIGCATVAQPLRNGLMQISGISGPRALRMALGLSLPDIGISLGNVHPNGHGGRPFSKSTVCHWEKGDYAMTPETQAAYLVLLEKYVADTTGGRLAVKVRFGRTWKVTALMVCTCGRPFKFRNITDKFCPRCRK